MSNQNIVSPSQAFNAFVQQQTRHIEGQPIRVYPFRITSGLNYFTSSGSQGLNTAVGSNGTNADNTPMMPGINTTNSNEFGGFSGVSLIYSGANPIIAYWFGVTNCTVNSDGSITTVINATWNNQLQAYVPDDFKNPINKRTEFPWHDLGLLDFSVGTGREQHAPELDNMAVQTMDTNYNIYTISNDWVPNFKEMNEFIYFIIDPRINCPIACRIDTIRPRYDPMGILQSCEISFCSINQYFNQYNRNILTYIKFGAMGDGYAFPQETIVNGKTVTVINPQLLNPNTNSAGVDEIEVRNNSLTAQLGCLVYGHLYQKFKPNANGQPEKTCEASHLLLPYKFVAPVNDNFDVSGEVVHSNYDLAMNMLVINEQIWSNWKQTREWYNVTQNWTFQGGLAFDNQLTPKEDLSNNVLFGSSYSILNNNPNYDTSSDPAYTSMCAPLGSLNLGNVLMSNAMGYPLSQIDGTWNVPWTSSPQRASGFSLVKNSIFDFRGLGLIIAKKDAQVKSSDFSNVVYLMNYIDTYFEFYYADSYQPTSIGASEIGALYDYYNNVSTSITAENFFILNSLSLLNVHKLEINYRDGIDYTNVTQGTNSFFDQLRDDICGIADRYLGYTPGYADFFLNTFARTYNVLIPHDITPLCNQYMNPEQDTVNAIPLDIFANTNYNNTSVGQLKYMSGYQFKLTQNFKTVNGTEVTTLNMRNYSQIADDAWVTLSDICGQDSSGDYYSLKVPNNSFCLFKSPLPPHTIKTTTPVHESYVIDEINVKQIGISNLHLTYYKVIEKNGKEQHYSVGEDWYQNSSKMMNNTSYIDNDESFNYYDEWNITLTSNDEPYIPLNYPADPVTSLSAKTSSTTVRAGDNSSGFHSYAVSSSAQYKGVDFNTNNTSGITYPQFVASEFAQWYPTNSVIGACINSVFLTAPLAQYTLQYVQDNCDKKTWYVTEWSNNLGSVLTDGKNGSTIWTLLQPMHSSSVLNNQPISQTTNKWWTSKCNTYSTAVNNGYLSGEVDVVTQDGLIAGAYPVSTGVWQVGSETTSVGANYPVGNTNIYWQGNLFGNFNNYFYALQYLVFNFQTLISTSVDNFSVSLPSNVTKWSYVLIPSGDDPSSYATTWQKLPDVPSGSGIVSCLLMNGSNYCCFSNGNYDAKWHPNFYDVANCMWPSGGFFLGINSTGYLGNYPWPMYYNSNKPPVTTTASAFSNWISSQIVKNKAVAIQPDGADDDETNDTAFGSWNPACAPSPPVMFPALAGIGIYATWGLGGMEIATSPDDSGGGGNAFSLTIGGLQVPPGVNEPGWVYSDAKQKSGLYLNSWTNAMALNIPTPDTFKQYANYEQSDFGGKYDLYLFYYCS